MRSLAAEQREEWLGGARYLDVSPRANHHKTQLHLTRITLDDPLLLNLKDTN